MLPKLKWVCFLPSHVGAAESIGLKCFPFRLAGEKHHLPEQLLLVSLLATLLALL